ncbi:MAG TPA: rhodanese-like domain-containing protein [Kofleriaceae bacterium]
MMSRIVLIGALCVAGCSQSEPPKPATTSSATTKDPQAARKLVTSGALVLDVRTSDEYAEGHLPSATNIPVQELASRLTEVDKLAGGDKARPIVVYCGAGSRAAKAKAQLEAAGYSHVVNGGGLDDLR